MEAGWQGKADGPTVTGEILTPSSTCAVLGSSVSMCSRTCLPQRVLTNVVRPVPEAPQTIRQNWIPFLTFFLRRSLMAGEDDMALSEVCREAAILCGRFDVLMLVRRSWLP